MNNINKLGGLLAVRLDDLRFGAGPGVVVAHPASAAEFEGLRTDRDGAHDSALRLWRGDSPIGSRVVAAWLPPDAFAGHREATE